MWYKRRVVGMFLAMMLTFTMVPGGFAAEETADAVKFKAKITGETRIVVSR